MISPLTERDQGANVQGSGGYSKRGFGTSTTTWGLNRSGPRRGEGESVPIHRSTDSQQPNCRRDLDPHNRLRVSFTRPHHRRNETYGVRRGHVLYHQIPNVRYNEAGPNVSINGGDKGPGPGAAFQISCSKPPTPIRTGNGPSIRTGGTSSPAFSNQISTRTSRSKYAPGATTPRPAAIPAEQRIPKMLPPANYRQSPVSEKSAQALRENRSVKDKSSGPGLISAAHLSNQQDDPRVNTTAPEAEALIDFSDDSDDSEVPVGGGKEKSKIPDPRGAPAIYYDVGIFYPPLKPHFTRPPSSGTSVQGGISEVQDLQVCTQRNDDSADHISVVSLDGCQVPGASAIQLRDDRASRDGREVRIWQEANKMDEAGSVLPPEAVQSRMPPEEVEHFDSRERVGGTVRVRLPGMPRTLLIGLDEPDGHPVNSDEPERYPISFIDHDDPSANDPHAQKPNDNYNNLKDLNTQNNTDSRLDKVDISDDEDLMTFDTHPIPPLKAALTTNPDNIPSSSTPFPQTQHPNKRLARTHIYRQQKQTAERELQRGQASPTTTDTKDYQNELQSLQEPAFATPTIVPPAKPTTDGAQEEDSVPRYKKTRRGLRKKKQLMDSEVARREGSAVEGGSPEMEAKGEYGEEVEGDGREEPNV